MHNNPYQKVTIHIPHDLDPLELNRDFEVKGDGSVEIPISSSELDIIIESLVIDKPSILHG